MLLLTGLIVNISAIKKDIWTFPVISDNNFCLFQRAVQQQVEEKQRLKREADERRRKEEAEEERRLAKEREDLQKQFDQENEKQKQKEVCTLTKIIILLCFQTFIFRWQ